MSMFDGCMDCFDLWRSRMGGECTKCRERAATIPTTSTHGLSRDHTGIREAGTEQNGGRLTPENRNNAARDSAAELNS